MSDSLSKEPIKREEEKQRLETCDWELEKNEWARIIGAKILNMSHNHLKSCFQAKTSNIYSFDKRKGQEIMGRLITTVILKVAEVHFCRGLYLLMRNHDSQWQWFYKRTLKLHSKLFWVWNICHALIAHYFQRTVELPGQKQLQSIYSR